jgi:uncharacterized protein YjbJ (UPF0337 family)
MNSNMESNNKVAGTINTAMGSVKEEAGKFSGNQDMENEGAVQKTKGQAQKFAGAIQDVIKKGQTLLGMKPKKS